MNRNYHKWLGGTMIAMAAFAFLSSCSDDHFDIDPGVSSRQTLWGSIKSRSELSQFADILSRTKYSKNEKTKTPQTYADLLDHDQTFTIWAPKDGTFDYEFYNNLLNTGKAEDSYRVEKELIRNSMTRFSHVMTGSDKMELDLFNSKTAVFDCGQGTIKSQKIVTPNVGASNGVLHITDGAVEYQPNVYEFIATRSDLDSLNAYIKAYEKFEFSEAQSTQGPTVNGQITWVDSVTFLSNDYLFGTLHAYLNREDSLYAMIMPTNKAWSEALERTQKFYHYKGNYVQTIVRVDANGNESTSSVTTALSDMERDSMTNLYSKNAIIGDYVFNARYQHGYSYKDFNKAGACDSLVNTINRVFYDPVNASLFDGQEPIEVSNGYVYVVDNFNLKVEDGWGEPMENQAEEFRYIDSYTGCTPTQLNLKQRFRVEDENNPENVVDSIVEVKLLRTVQTSSAANPSVTFKMPETMSCKYDIYVLMAYNTEANLPNKFRAQISYHTADESKSSMENVNLNVPEGMPGEGRDFENRPPRIENGQLVYVDSILVAKDFEFPVCYKGLSDAYATLRLNSYVTSRQTSQYSREMWIDQIVLKAKEE